MKEFFVYAWATIRGWKWLEIVQALAAVWVALVATRALKTWKEQSKAERKAKLLDELLEVVHQFLGLIGKPLSMAEFVKIGMNSHQPTWLSGDQRIAGAVAYIKKAGADDSKRLFEAIGACRSSKERIDSLALKGQVMSFKNYYQCQNATTLMTHQLGRLDAIAAMIASSSMNWENPEVRAQVENVNAEVILDHPAPSSPK